MQLRGAACDADVVAAARAAYSGPATDLLRIVRI
jgi:hypothetical protein